MYQSDADLLREYARHGSESAFAELVRRHLDLVYAAAKRQVHSSALAEDIAQSVFIDLSRHAARLGPGTPLVAWLHLVTRRTAIDALRREKRRQNREKDAMEIAAMKTTPSAWTQVEPLLDEALATLDDADRSAVLLRYFENKSLRDIGEILGASEDAAQKRVTRAVERLRAALVRRGLTVTAAGLITDLSAHAIQIAPATLASSVTAAAVALGTTTLQITAVETARNLAMTSLQKSIATGAVALVLGLSCYEAVMLARQRSDIAARQQRATELTAQLSATRGDQNAAAAQLESLEDQIDSRLASAAARLASGDAALEAQMKNWLASLDQLKRFLDQHPNLRTPELQLLSEQDWLNAAGEAKLDSVDGLRRALAELRQIAGNALMNKMRRALGGYVAANNGALPGNVAQLLPFFDPPIEATWLDRYEMLHSGKASDLIDTDPKPLIAAKSPVDVEHDTFFQLTSTGFRATSAMYHNISAARQTFSAAHSGQRAATAAQLAPYLKWPVSESAVEKFLNPSPASAAP